MNPIDLMKRPAAYACGYENAPAEAQRRAKQLCWAYNQTSPEDAEKRRTILRELLGTYHPLANIESDFRCDYGFNIHIHGLAVINYNCVILDTSPVHIGAGAFIAPGVCLACSGHSVDPEQRSRGIGTSAPITLENDVWIGANATVCGGRRALPCDPPHHGDGQDQAGADPFLKAMLRRSTSWRSKCWSRTSPCVR